MEMDGLRDAIQAKAQEYINRRGQLLAGRTVDLDSLDLLKAKIEEDSHTISALNGAIEDCEAWYEDVGRRQLADETDDDGDKTPKE